MLPAINPNDWAALSTAVCAPIEGEVVLILLVKFETKPKRAEYTCWSLMANREVELWTSIPANDWLT